MDLLLSDLSYALTLMRKHPLFTLVVVFTLALGIGATTAIFTVVNDILLHPVPYPESARLVMIWERLPKLGEKQVPVSAPEYIDYRDHAKLFDGVAGFENTDLNLTDEAFPEHLIGARVAADLFSVLKINAMIGRTFSSADERPDAEHVAIISDALWRKRYNADPNATGRTIRLNEQPYTIVGIMPRSFKFPMDGMPFSEPAEVWIPLIFTKSELENRASGFSINVIARIKPGVSIEQANSSINALAAAFVHDYPQIYAKNLRIEGFANSLPAQVISHARPLLLLLLSAVILVLLVACANVASMLLARSASRQKEISVRHALGATRPRIVRQLLTENLLIALMAGAIGVALAIIIIAEVRRFGPADMPRLHDVRVDVVVLLFAVILSVFTGLLFGLAPVRRLSIGELGRSLAESSGRMAGGKEWHRMGNTLVIAEMALTLVLLTMSGLLISSFIRVLEVSPGFATQGSIVAHTFWDAARYPDGQLRAERQKAILTQLKSLPGVKATAESSHLPLYSESRIGIRLENENYGEVHIVDNDFVSPSYFQAMQIALERGRVFNEEDTSNSPLVAVVTKSLAQRFWPNDDAIGKRIRWGKDRPPFAVVGIVDDVRASGLDAEAPPMIFMSAFQLADNIGPSTVFIVRTENDPAALASATRSAIWSVDKDIPIYSIAPMSKIVQNSVEQRRFFVLMLSAFSFGSLLLAGAGLYGLISYVTSQRTREFGIRMALGATPSQIVQMVLRKGVLLVLVGVVAGLIITFGLARLLQSMLYRVQPYDIVTFSTSSLLLVIVALLASFVPAIRAASTDPNLVLREE